MTNIDHLTNDVQMFYRRTLFSSAFTGAMGYSTLISMAEGNTGMAIASGLVTLLTTGITYVHHKAYQQELQGK